MKPLLQRFSIVRSLPLTASQAIKECLGIERACQRKSAHGTALSTVRMISQAVRVVKFPLEVGFQIRRSSLEEVGV